MMTRTEPDQTREHKLSSLLHSNSKMKQCDVYGFRAMEGYTLWAIETVITVYCVILVYALYDYVICHYFLVYK